MKKSKLTILGRNPHIMDSYNEKKLNGKISAYI